tara:strand:+ start:1487 stop:3295 length:1809 start_codon:yes stop_codon:yes gene_type:complete
MSRSSSSFWESKDLIPVAQKKVSIPAEFGLNYSAGQKVQINIPAGIDFFQPKETYLKFDVTIAGATAGTRRLFLDAETGGQVLIRDLRIYSGGAGRILLEEYQNYNVLTALKYDYETNDNYKKKRALTEGAQIYNPACRSTHGGKKSQANDCRNNPYFYNGGTSATSDTATHTSDDHRHAVKCLLPLNTGIFQSDRVFPSMLTEGLIIEIILEQNTNVFRQLDTTLQFRNTVQNPVFQSVTGSGSSTTGGIGSADTGSNGSFTTFYLRRDNQQGTGGVVGNCPFVVGQDVVLADINDSAVVLASGSGSAQTKITSIVYDASTSPPMLAVTVNASMFNKSGAPILINEAVLAQDTRTVAYKPTYTISDTELIVQQVQMPDGFKARMIGMLKEGGTLNYDFLSATNYKFSQLAGDTVANIRLPVNESRAKAIFMIPTDASQYTPEASMNACGTYFIEPAGAVDGAMADIEIHSTRSGLVGIADYIRDYQILYDGKLNPTRPVPCGKISDRVSIEQQPLIELEKALAMGGIHPLSFAKFRENFCIGRALSLQDGVADLRGKDFSLQVQYDLPDAGEPGAKNKLWMNWVSHLRRIVVRGDAISLEI